MMSTFVRLICEGTREYPEDIGQVSIAFANAVSGPVRQKPGLVGKPVNIGSYDGRSGRRCCLMVCAAQCDRDIFQDFSCCRCRHGHGAVCATDRAAPKLNSGTKDTVRFQILQADGGTDNIHDGVKCTDFVKMDFINSDAMNFGFSFCDNLKHVHGTVLCGCRQGAVSYNLFNIVQVSVFVVVTMVVMVVVAVRVIVVMIVTVPMPVLILIIMPMAVPVAVVEAVILPLVVPMRMPVPGAAVMFMPVMVVSIPRFLRRDMVQDHIDTRTLDALLFPPAHNKFETIHRKFSQFGFEMVCIHPGIDHGAKMHIAGYSGKTVVVKYFH